MSNFFTHPLTKLALGLVAGLMLSIVYSGAALAKSELEIVVDRNTIDFDKSAGTIRVSTNVFKEGYFKIIQRTHFGTWSISEGGTLECGGGVEQPGTAFNVLSAWDSSGKIDIDNMQQLPSGNIKFILGSQFSLIGGGNAGCEEKWAEITQKGDTTISHNKEEVAVQVVSYARQSTGAAEAGKILSPALQEFKSAFVNRAKTQSPPPAGCTTIAGTVSCEEGAFQLMTGQCWVQAANSVGAGIGITNFGDEVKKRAAACISRASYGNESRATTILSRLQAINYEETSKAIAKAMDDREAGIREDLNSNPGDADKEASSCVIDGIGWLVCPIMTFMAGVADGAYGVIEQFLQVDVKIMDQSSGTYTAWKVFRNIANAAFIVVFLIVIFSQITSMGISNYGLKRIFPRLIVAAILVNVSFFICQIMVDITQILGSSLSSFLGGLVTGEQAAGGNAWLEVIGKVLAGAVILTAVVGSVAVVALSISAPVLLASLLAIVLTVVILIGRQAAVVILTVLSPLAFVAYLLPNTENLYKKWMKMFWGLLMVYPTIALLYGGSKLAGNIIHNSNPSSFWMNIVALGVTSIPLIMTPSLLRSSMNATGSLGAKLNSWGNKADGMLKSGIGQSRLGDVRRNMKTSADLRRAKARAGIRTRRKGGNFNPANWVNAAGAGLNKYTNSFIPGTSGKYDRIASSIESKEYQEAVDVANAKYETMPSDNVLNAAKDNSLSAAERQAAALQIMERGSHDQKKQLIEGDYSGEGNERLRMALAASYAKSDLKNLYGAQVAGSITKGTPVNLMDSLRENAGNISGATVATNSNYAKDLVSAFNGANAGQQSKIKGIVSSIDSSPNISPVGDVETELAKIRTATATKTAAKKPAAKPATAQQAKNMINQANPQGQPAVQASPAQTPLRQGQAQPANLQPIPQAPTPLQQGQARLANPQGQPAVQASPAQTPLRQGQAQPANLQPIPQAPTPLQQGQAQPANLQPQPIPADDQPVMTTDSSGRQTPGSVKPEDIEGYHQRFGSG